MLVRCLLGCLQVCTRSSECSYLQLTLTQHTCLHLPDFNRCTADSVIYLVERSLYVSPWVYSWSGHWLLGFLEREVSTLRVIHTFQPDYALSITELIVFRGIAGAGGGGIVSMAQIVISDVVSLRER